MSTDTRPGGFTGDPAEAFSPPGASSCCGGAVTPATTNSTSTNSCCGSAATEPDIAASGDITDTRGCCG